MSTILKALRRLEQEKSRPAGQRPLREEVAHASLTNRQPRRSWRAAALAGGVGVAAGASLLLLWPQGGEPPEPLAVTSPAPRATAPQPSAEQTPRERAASERLERRRAARAARAAAPAPAPDSGELSDDALTSPVAVVRRPQAKPRVADDAPRRAAPPGPAVASAPPADAAEFESSEVSFEAAEPEPAGLAGAEPAPKLDAAGEGARLAAEVRVEQTLWHPRPERRVAVLEVPGREAPLRVHEGDAVGSLVVSKIEPSGVVFTREGQSLRRALGAER